MRSDAQLAGIAQQQNTLLLMSSGWKPVLEATSSDKVGLVGCRWLGKVFTLGLERDEDTVAQYTARSHAPAFTNFADNLVNGRTGVRFSVFPDHTDCAQLMDGEPVSLSVTVVQAGLYSGPRIDSCVEVLRIAQMIEPRLPKAAN